MSIRIREMTAADRDLWADMHEALWPDVPRDEHMRDIEWILGRENYWAYVAEANDGAPLGFAEVAMRDYANGCTGRPVPFLEGIWVRPDRRRTGIGAALVKHIAGLFIVQGYSELCSDADIENTASHVAHASWGFAETERVIYFRKSLEPTAR